MASRIPHTRLHTHPDLEETPDLSRYETRLAAEVALLTISHTHIPHDQVQAYSKAQQHMFRVLAILAKGG